VQSRPSKFPRPSLKAVSTAIRVAEVRRDEIHRERDAVRDADLASLGEVLDSASVRQDQLTADLATRTTELDQLIAWSTSLAAEKDRPLADLDAEKYDAAGAEALLAERTGVRDRLHGQLKELRIQLAAAASERDQAWGRAAALAAFAPSQPAEQRVVPVSVTRRRAVAQLA
jgi:hypothetical protein